MTAQSPQRRESLSPTPLTPTEPATPKSNKALSITLNGTKERKTGSNKLQKSSPPPAESISNPSKLESISVAAKTVEKRLSSVQLDTSAQTNTRASFETTSTPAKLREQQPIKPLPGSNSFYGAIPTEKVVPNAQLLSPVSPPLGPPRTQSQPNVEETVKRAHQHLPGPKRADTDPVALPPAHPEPLLTRPASPIASSKNPQRNTSVVNSPAPAPVRVPGPEPEPENAVTAEPSRQNSAHNSARSMTSTSTAPSQVLETPSDLAQEQEPPKLLPKTESVTSLVKTPNHGDEADMDVSARSVTKSKERHSLVSRSSQSSREHERKEDVLPPPTSKKNDIVQVLVKRGEKSRKVDVSYAPAPTSLPTQQSPAQQPSVQQPPTQQPPMSTSTTSPVPSKAPPSAARTLLPTYVPSRRRQASSPISKGEVEAARALGVVLYYPLDKHIRDPRLLEELLAYLSFHEFVALSSTSKRIHTMLEDRKELRETVLERFLATVGYVRWDFGTKEPLELTLKVCVRLQLRGGFLPTQFFFSLCRTSTPTSGACPSRSTGMRKSLRPRRRVSPPAGQRPELSACLRPPLARTAVLSFVCAHKPRPRQSKMQSHPMGPPMDRARARSGDLFPRSCAHRCHPARGRLSSRAHCTALAMHRF